MTEWLAQTSLCFFRSKIQQASSLLWWNEQCHQCYKTPLPFTCSIVWIMLSDHFNRLLGYRFSWVCRMRDEAGSWGGVLKNNTKCSIFSLQSRGTGDKLQHTKEETIHKTIFTVWIHTYIHAYICTGKWSSAPHDCHQPHNLTIIIPFLLLLWLFGISISLYIYISIEKLKGGV